MTLKPWSAYKHGASHGAYLCRWRGVRRSIVTATIPKIAGRSLLALGISVAALPSAGLANNDACWGDNRRGDISCARLTESFLLSLRGISRAQVQKAMDAPGRETGDQGLQFLSNYNKGVDGGSGLLNVAFQDDRAIIINATVDSAGAFRPMQFVWNAYATPGLAQDFDLSTKDFGRQPYCSDISRRPMTCRSGSVEKELMLYKMSFGASKVELLQVLQSSCNVPGMTVSDPDGDCDRYRRLLQ
jgi:hypothetical protein